MQPRSRVYAAAAVATLILPTLAACSSGAETTAEPNFTSVASSTAPTSQTSETKASATTNDKADTWIKAYEYVLDHPGDYPVSAAADYEPKGTYSYALVEANGDNTPELLLQVDSLHFSPVLAFTIGSDGKAIGTQDVLIQGASPAGGSRARVDASASGIGIHQVTYHSVQEYAYSTTFKPSRTKLTKVSDEVEYASQSELPDHLEVKWYATTDKSGLRSSQPTTGGSAAGTKPKKPSSGQGKLAAGPGEVALEGTMLELSASEAINKVGVFDADPAARYRFFKLDQPTQVTGKQGPGTRTEKVQWLFFGRTDTPIDGGSPSDLVGKHARLIIDQTLFHFSNEPAFPELAPFVEYARDYEILD
ncbi:hypothetical protein CGLAU_04720 [Corynebacterium glaucum]|uniref:Uncharacterized protein n=1 Tax=Corynebacterium glaucum TaxID=187491 RepID=A0A1Q2HVN8_9CORY|nr:hypothetical protein [Corynebacterium glaucum]AQQ14918.1 hypothetical protein CGLAU_04720 [Corynebacterium glaucum]